MKKYEIEYKDCTGMRCGAEIEALHEKEAIINLQQELIDDGDYMTELISVDKVESAIHTDEPKWELVDGTVLDQEHQDALNDAMNTYTNENGLTLEQAMERASQRRKEQYKKDNK